MENRERSLRIPRSWMENDADYARECQRPQRPQHPHHPKPPVGCGRLMSDPRCRLDIEEPEGFVEPALFAETESAFMMHCGCHDHEEDHCEHHHHHTCDDHCGCDDSCNDNCNCDDPCNDHCGCGCDDLCNDNCGCNCDDLCNDNCGCSCDDPCNDNCGCDRPGCGCQPDDSHNDDNCGCDGRSLAMAYEENQTWYGKREIYLRPKALLRGTLFVELDMPFAGRGGCQDE